MNKNLVLYDSIYGGTWHIADLIGRICGPSRLINIQQASGDDIDASDSIIIGTPVYSDNILPTVSNFIEQYGKRMRGKPVAVFVVSLLHNECLCEHILMLDYMSDLLNLLPEDPILSANFCGSVRVDALSPQHRARFADFCRRFEVEVQDIDMQEWGKITEFAVVLREKLFSLLPGQIAPQELCSRIETYMEERKNCVLATNGLAGVLATPMEYRYDKGRLYFLSESGLKFANLHNNCQVSVAIADAFHSFADIRGLQLTGRGKIIEPGEEQYIKGLELWDMNEDHISRLHCDMHMICVVLERAEYLDGSLKKEGYDVRQMMLRNCFE